MKWIYTGTLYGNYVTWPNSLCVKETFCGKGPNGFMNNVCIQTKNKKCYTYGQNYNDKILLSIYQID